MHNAVRLIMGTLGLLVVSALLGDALEFTNSGSWVFYAACLAVFIALLPNEPNEPKEEK